MNSTIVASRAHCGKWRRGFTLRLGLVAALAFTAILRGGNAAAAGACSSEVLQVRGTPVTVNYCLTGAPQQAPGSELLVPVRAAYSAPGGSLSEQTTMHFLAGEATSRVIESIDLSKLGSSGTLHLTLAYRDGQVRVESAILTPGAIIIK